MEDSNRYRFAARHRAEELAELTGRPHAVHIAGPGRYVVAEYQEGDDELCRGSFLEVARPLAKAEAPDA